MKSLFLVLPLLLVACGSESPTSDTVLDAGTDGAIVSETSTGYSLAYVAVGSGLTVGKSRLQLRISRPDGAPAPVERTLIKPPSSRVGPVTAVERGVLIQTDAIGAKYDTLVDRESAEELLAAKSNEAAAAAAEAKADSDADKAEAAQAKLDAQAVKQAERERLAAQKEADRAARADAQAQRQAEREAANSPWNKAITSATRSASSTVGRTIASEVTKAVLGGSTRRRSTGGGLLGGLVRGVLGGLFKG